MKVLVVGGGGREHALSWKISQSPKVSQVFVAPGNGGTELEPKLTNVSIEADDIDGLARFALDENINLTIIGSDNCEIDIFIKRKPCKSINIICFYRDIS